MGAAGAEPATVNPVRSRRYCDSRALTVPGSGFYCAHVGWPFHVPLSGRNLSGSTYGRKLILKLNGFPVYIISPSFFQLPMLEVIGIAWFRLGQ
jgi:hypothetical protein